MEKEFNYQNLFSMKSCVLRRTGIAAAALLGCGATPLLAEYEVTSHAVAADGQFTVVGDTMHYWSGATGYNLYDVNTGTTTNIGKPPNGTTSNGYGDPFGVYDPDTGFFYAATYTSGERCDIYVYDTVSSTWLTEGPSGNGVTNAFGAATYNGSLYISGLNEPWDGGYGQDTFIYTTDLMAGTENDAEQDMLILTSFNSANVAVDSDGGVYYIPYSIDNSTALYYWSAEQVASVTDDVDSGEPDDYLTLADAAVLAELAGGGNGIAVDDAGNVFFTLNNSADGSFLGMYDPEIGSGYEILYTADSPYAWLGAVSIDGNFKEGDSVYFSPYGSITEVSMVPEPAMAAFFLGLGALVLGCTRRRRREVGST